ncbi:MAG: MBL fold metallo-hydrolase [Vicinamibacterales bacterium]
MKTRVMVAVALTWAASAVQAQDARSVLEAASTALGAGTLRSLEFSARGSDFIFGQPYDGHSQWPRFSVPGMTMTIDFVTPALRDDRRRQQVQNPPLGGGFQPLIGELRQTWLLSGSYAWDVVGGNPVAAAAERDFRSAVDGRLAQVWLSPHGFVKAALAGAPSLRTETVRGARKMVVTFKAPNGARFEGVLNDAHVVERIETWLDSPVLGDTKFEAIFSDYKEYGGIRFPGRIVQREGGYPVLDVVVTDVKPNVAVNIEVPAAIRQAVSAASAPLNPEKLAEGVWLIPGAAKSVAVEFRDFVVVVDAPETEARSLLVLDAVRKVIPNKPIRYVVNTHHHFDHAGGLRTYVAEGTTVVTHVSNIPFYQQVWSNPRTLNPDRLAKVNRAAVFEGVVGARVLTDGARDLAIYHYAGNMHNAGMLMVFLPRERILIEADSYTPPANAGDPPGAVPNLVHFAEAVERLRLDPEQVVPIHGRLVTYAEIRQAIDTFGGSQLFGR